MKKTHALLIALLLAMAAGLGLAAVTKTVELQTAASATRPSPSAVAARSRRLDQVAAALQRARRDKPPALPTLNGQQHALAAPSGRVIYRRPTPVVVIEHGSDHDFERDHEAEGGDDD
jgi:hypothetical protein